MVLSSLLLHHDHPSDAEGCRKVQEQVRRSLEAIRAGSTVSLHSGKNFEQGLSLRAKG